VVILKRKFSTKKNYIIRSIAKKIIYDFCADYRDQKENEQKNFLFMLRNKQKMQIQLLTM
jgi:hypothetical protein